jgi:phenylpyruvate tautomerase PptA (4-oxalocrotonate tautomerase family)
MKQPPGIKYFDDLEDAIEGAVNTLQQKVTAGNPTLLEQLQELLGMFEKRGTSIRKSAENLRLLNEMSRRIDAVLQESALPLATRQFLETIPASAELVNGYFASILSDFTSGRPVYNAITQFYTRYTTEALIGQGVNQQFKQGILDVLRQSVKNGISTPEAKKVLAKYVVEDNRLAKQVSQVASDALHQYSAEYTQVVTNDLGLQHYYYKGTKITSTRPFCSTRTGKYFTKKEVEGWAKLEWSGKIPGTNKDNILTLRGGYSCRHLLVPVSEAVYKARVNATKPV